MASAGPPSTPTAALPDKGHSHPETPHFAACLSPPAQRLVFICSLTQPYMIPLPLCPRPLVPLPYFPTHLHRVVVLACCHPCLYEWNRKLYIRAHRSFFYLSYKNLKKSVWVSGYVRVLCEWFFIAGVTLSMEDRSRWHHVSRGCFRMWYSFRV